MLKFKPDTAALGEWWGKTGSKAINCLGFDQSSEIIKPQYAIHRLWETQNIDAYVTTEVGQHQMGGAILSL